MPELVVESGEGAGGRYVIAPNGLTIGRGDNCTIKLNNSDVSRSHARIEEVGGRFRFVDQSTNGSVVNGQLVRNASMFLNPGDRIGVMGTVFRLENQPFQATAIAAPYYPQQQQPVPQYAQQQSNWPPAPQAPSSPQQQQMIINCGGPPPQVLDYTLNAILTLVAYIFLYPIGLIMNIVFLSSGSSIKSRTGQEPVAMGCMWALFVVFFILPLIGLFLFLMGVFRFH